MDQNTVLEPYLHSNIPYRNRCKWKRLTGSVLSISEDLTSRGQRPSLPHDQIWAKLQFWIIQMYLVANFVNVEDLLGQS